MPIGLLWYHARPFVAGVGHSFLHHAPDRSFPSDHGTVMFTVSLVLAASSVPAAKRFGRSPLPLAFVVAWSRVFLGVHWPLDMVGALYRRALAPPIARGWLRP